MFRFTLLIATALTLACTQSPAKTPTESPPASSIVKAPAVEPPVGETITLDDKELRARLTSEQFHILREEGTERAFTGALLKNKADGVYRCAACNAPVFSSETKFKSGTGWPSFYAPIEKARINEKVDGKLGMRRVEIECHRCGSHLGHVFEDGPKPTGLRYCINSASLAFTPAEKPAQPAADETPKKPAE